MSAEFCALEPQMLETIDAKKPYYDSHGKVVIVGFVKKYVVFRRPGAAVQVTTLNDFSTKFSETQNVAEVEESKDRKTWMHAGDYLGGGY